MKKSFFNLNLRLLTILGALALMGCQPHGTEHITRSAYQIHCGDFRPTVCTREYAPVCAVRSDEQVTYATACTACADERVSEYTQGACEGEK